MNTIFTHIKSNIYIYTLLVIFIFLFFFRLDYNTLTSWDEAWYASISRAMVQSGDFFLMKWNGIPYYDHPPMGFWLMALSYKIFGISELSTRLPSAILGVSSSVFIFLTAKRLTGEKNIGFVASLIMGTCVWYVIRVRSGNLDGDFIFFYITTIYFALLSREHIAWLPVTMICFASLLLTKTLIGISAIPLLMYLIFNQLIYIKRNFWYFIVGIVVFIAVLLPWYYVNYKTYPDFIVHHFFQIGARSKTFASYFNLHPEQPLFYIHMGVRKWYYPWLLSLCILSISIVYKLIKRKIDQKLFVYIFLLLWNFVVVYPFLTSDKTELWHLIPVYLPLAFIVAIGFHTLADIFSQIIFRMLSYFKLSFLRKNFKIITQHNIYQFVMILYLIFFISITLLQVKTFYTEVIPVNKYIPDDVAISKAVGKYNKKVYLDDDFFPLCVYYSNKHILPLYDLSSFGESIEKNTMVKLFKSNEKDFVVITRSWAVDNLIVEKIPYTVLEKNNSFTILTR